MWVWGPVTNPTARAFASWLCALWGRREGAWAGASLARVWHGPGWELTHARAPVLGACGLGPLPTGCGCGGCGCGDLSPTPQCALLRAGFARCWGRARAPRGWALLPGCGTSGVGRSPRPDRPSLRPCGRGPLPTGCGCGGCGRGDRPPVPRRALSRAGCARCGGGARAPGGVAPLEWVRGVRGWALALARPPILGACCRGPLPTGFGGEGSGRGDPSPTPGRALLRAGCAR